MSEESLLAGAEEGSTPNEESSNENNDTGWSWGEDIPGEGDAPEWFKGDKFKSVSAQAEAYKSLEGKLGGFTGSPDEYENTMPEDIEGEFIDGDPLMDDFQAWAKDNQLNQEAYTQLLHTYLRNEHNTMSTSRESELQALGKDAQSRLNNISDYAKANLNEEQYQGILQATTTAAGVQAIEALIDKARGPGVPTGKGSEIPTGPTHSELQERMRDERYQTDPAFRAETSKMYEQVFGKGEKTNVVG